MRKYQQIHLQYKKKFCFVFIWKLFYPNVVKSRNSFDLQMSLNRETVLIRKHHHIDERFPTHPANIIKSINVLPANNRQIGKRFLSENIVKSVNIFYRQVSANGWTVSTEVKCDAIAGSCSMASFPLGLKRHLLTLCIHASWNEHQVTLPRYVTIMCTNCHWHK